MLGVARREHAMVEHLIIGRELALDTQSASRKPDEWIEPMHRDGELCDRTCEAIAARDVSELVREDDATAFSGPRFGVGREENHRYEHAGHGRCLDRGAHANLDGAPGNVEGLDEARRSHDAT